MLGYHQQQKPYISSASTGPLSSAKSATLVPSTYNISTANDMSVVSAPADTAILTTLPISDITVSTQGMTNTVALTRPRDTTVSMSGLSNLLNIPKQQYHPEFILASCHHLQRPFAVAPLHESQPFMCGSTSSPLPMPVPYTIPICEQSESLAESNGYWPDLDGQILSTPIVASPAFTFANLTSVPSAYATQYAESKEALSSTPVVPTLPPLHLPLDLLQAAADALATEVHLQTKSTSSHVCTCTAASDLQSCHLLGLDPLVSISLRPTSSASTIGSCSAMDTAQDTSTLAPCESASTTTASIISSSAISTPPPVLTRQAANAPMKMYQEMFEMDDVHPGSYRDPAVSISPSVKQSGAVSSIYDTRLSAAVSSKLSGTNDNPNLACATTMPMGAVADHALLDLTTLDWALVFRTCLKALFCFEEDVKSESGIRVNDNLNTTPASSTRMQLVSQKPTAQTLSHQEILDSELDGTERLLVQVQSRRLFLIIAIVDRLIVF
ncbi:hypothetical protein BSLG_005904 [Batrachochytrium salamandrivorans]|nr:hypothetical protein BSLG_005904 [Batrachochytrium salamandrivorans]